MSHQEFQHQLNAMGTTSLLLRKDSTVLVLSELTNSKVSHLHSVFALKVLGVLSCQIRIILVS